MSESNPRFYPQTQKFRMPSLRRALGAGLVSALVSSLLCNVALPMLRAGMGIGRQVFPELNFGPVFSACLLSNVVGGVVFYVLAQRTVHPTRIFFGLALALALVDSIVVLLRMPPGFGRVASPLHFLNAWTAASVIPRVALSPAQESGTSETETLTKGQAP